MTALSDSTPMMNVFLSSFSMGNTSGLGMGTSGGINARRRRRPLAERDGKRTVRLTFVEPAPQVDRLHRVDAVALLVERPRAELLLPLAHDVDDGAVPADHLAGDHQVFR